VTDQLIRDDYRCFNERRIMDAGALFAPSIRWGLTRAN
jgi:hypothetical protein